MPQVYLAPGANVAAGHTNYLTAREKGTIFPGKDALGMASIADGVSNTILVVEAADAKAVPWTKPDDYIFDPMNPSRGLAGLRGDFILASFADGSVHRLSKDLDPEMFRRLFQRDDGQPVDFERR
jgi:hypothetical protein